MDSDPGLADKARRFLRWVNNGGDEFASLSLVELAELAAAYAERAFDRIDGEQQAKSLACRRGCDWCCYLPVESSLAEATRALEFARNELDTSSFAALCARIGAADAAYPPPAHQPLSKNPPCPFLVAGACQVYPARPLACRGWNSLDVKACETAWHEGVGAVKVPVNSRIQGVYVNASEALSRALVRDGRGEHLHLVPALAVALGQ